MMAVCPVCGKYQVITWPEHWVYRRRDHYLCSENCLIVFDVREYKERTGWIDDYKRRNGKMRKKITLEQKKKAVEIALKGGTAPLKFLEACGAANPSASWFYIKKTVKEKDPETWRKLQEITGEKEEKPMTELHMAEVPKPVVNMTIDAEDLAEHLDEHDLTQEQQELVVTMEGKQIGTMPADAIRSAMENVFTIRKNMDDEGPKPLRYDGFEVTTIRNEFGQFHYDKKHNLLDWESPDGEEVSWSPDCWKIFATEALPKAMAILGAKF